MVRHSTLSSRWRGTLAAVLVALTLPLAVACGDDGGGTASNGPATSTPTPSTSAPTSEGFLIAADHQASQLYVFKLPELVQTGQLDGVKLGNHNGAIVLGDGRILFSDDRAGTLVALRISGDGKPEISQRTAATLGTGAVWSSVSPDGKYWAVSGGIDDAREQPLNIVDLTSFKNVVVNVPMADGEELHPYLTNDLVAVGGGGEMRAWKLADVLKGTLGAPISTVGVAKGAHGLVTHDASKRLYLTTNDGLEAIAYESGALGAKTVIPWNSDGLSGGKNARPRLGPDGNTVLGAIGLAVPPEPERWAEREQHLHAANLASGTAKRMPLARGLVTRFQLSAPYAMFVNLTGTGDAAIFVDIDPKSARYLSVAGRADLGTLASGPAPGATTSGKESRAGAMTADGRWAFVSHGGEGKISVIDTKTFTVTRTVTVPTPLKAGGYLVAYQPGQRLWDLSSR